MGCCDLRRTAAPPAQERPLMRAAAGSSRALAGRKNAPRKGACFTRQPPRMAASAAARPRAAASSPVLILDVMDTIVTDPFFETMPKFFGMSFKELLEAKHPTAWVEFEKALISEQQLLSGFFKDGRTFDHSGLIAAMVEAYDYIEGMPQLLQRLKDAGYPMHVCSNYPMWFERIEGKLQLSQYLSWTFVSCHGPMKGMRKPALDAFECVAATLQLPPSGLIFVDDRQPNVEGAAAAGMDAIRFESAAQLERDLLQRGLQF